ncbi:ImuA family protein [Roseibium sp. M-1]
MTLKFSSVYPLKHARAHEVCGDGALAFAAIAAGTAKGAVVWISERWRPTVHPEGLAPYCDPGRLLLTRADSQLTVLASAETALRSGAAGLVVAEVSGAIGLTEGRRLQLAAEAGGTTAVLLIPEGAGSNAAETRWRCAGAAGPSTAVSIASSGTSSSSPIGPRQNGHDSTHWRWSLIKNKIGTLSEWVVRWDAASHRVIVVSEAGG